MIAAPDPIHHIQPLRGAGIAVIMLLEMDAVFFRFIRPPGGDHVERKPATADVINVGGLLGQQRRRMKRGTHRHHQLQRARDRSQGGGGGPGIERRRLRPFDVVEVEFGNQREIEADLLAAARQAADIFPARLHVLVSDIAQPAAEDREPISVAHQRASCSR